MGLFSSKTKHVYNVSGTELYEDMPPLVQQTVQVAVRDNRNIGKDIMANLVNGVLWKVRGLHNWASIEGNYPWGLPNGTMADIVMPKDVTVKNAVSADVGYPVHLGFIRIEPTGSSFTYYVEYWKISPYGEIKGEPDLWTYDTAEGTYPTLDIAKRDQVTPYLPIIPVRINNEYMDESEDKQPIDRAMNYLGLDMQSLCNDMRDSEEEAGSDNMPDDSYVVLAASLTRDTERTNEYLFRFFRRMYGESKITIADHEYWLNNKNPDDDTYDGSTSSTQDVHTSTLPPMNEMTIADARYKQTLQWNYITHRLYDGSLEGKKRGEHAIRFVRRTERKYDKDDDSHYKVTYSDVIISKQVTPTQVEEYTVTGLYSSFDVVNRSTVGVSLESVLDDPDNLEVPFLIPLRDDILRDMGNIKGHDLIYESVWLMGMHHDKYKVKWYQRGIFKIVMIVATVAVGFIIGGPAGAITALKAVMIGMVINTLFMPMLQDIFGEELALVIAAIATAVGAGFDFSSFAESATGTMAEITTAVATATTVAGVSVVSLASAAQMLYGGFKGMELADEMEDLQVASADLTEDLEKMGDEQRQKAYDVGITMAGISNDSWNIMDPNQYVSNVLREPNKPLMSPLYVSKYVDASLHLDIPKTVLNLGHA